MRLPDPTRFLRDPWTPLFSQFVITAAAVATGIIAIRAGSERPWAIVLAGGAAVSGGLAWNRLQRSEGRRSAMVWFLIAFVAAVIGVLSGGTELVNPWQILLAVAPLGLLWLTARAPSKALWRIYVLIPLLFGLTCLAAAAIMGELTAGGFPAALAIFLSFVLHATHRIEADLDAPADPSDHPEVHRIHRGTLARISIVFFLFGVICLWPWLGRIYSNAYFGVMVGGVLVPIMLYWGRLRQPRAETSYEALVRFNRLAPYLAFVLIVALIIG
ncbi:hypothetical protein HZB60_05205 [candidate division KSB1 bacterium]|nr:hypothetical protein [candidate division KSB1 bacterium]